MPPLVTQAQIPATDARQRWAVDLFVSIDPEESLGVSGSVTDLSLSSAASFSDLNNLNGRVFLPAGTIESLDFGQVRKIKERFALGVNSLSPFQNIPQQASYTLRLSRVFLKKIPEVERVFNFLPSNLVLQQFPFIIQIVDAGDGTPDTEIRHYLFNCWFSDTNIHYDVTSIADTKLIQTATVTVGRVLTFDQSLAGTPGFQAATAFGSLLVSSIDSSSDDTLSNLAI